MSAWRGLKKQINHSQSQSRHNIFATIKIMQEYMAQSAHGLNQGQILRRTIQE